MDSTTDPLTFKSNATPDKDSGETTCLSPGKSKLGVTLEHIKRCDFQHFRERLGDIDWTPHSSNHLQVQSAFGTAAAFGIDGDEAERVIRELIRAHGGRIVDRDIHRLREYAYRMKNGTEGTARPIVPQVKTDPDLVTRVSSAVGDVDAEAILRERSFVDPGGADLGFILSSLYEVGEKVLILQNTRGQGDCLYEVGSPIPDSLPRQADEGIFFLINPVDSLWHPNPRENGKSSRRSEESITTYRYMLLESDVVPEESWLKILLQLPLPIAAVYSSGGKSIHSLIRVDAEDKAAYERERALMLPLLCALGADRQATTAVRLSRLPTAFRGSKEQRLLYLNPTPDSMPICSITTHPTTDPK